MPRRGLERLRREGKRSLTVEPWRVREVGLDPERLAAHESVFALGNGYLGVRGVLEEGPPPGARSVPGTFLNGFHELDEIVYPEGGYGQAKVRQTLLNVTAATGLTVSIDGEHVGCGERARDHERTLDLRAGTLTRTLTWHGSGGKRTRLTYTRCVSLEHAGRMALRLEVEPLDGPVALEVTHRLDGRVQNQVERGDPRLGSALGGQVLLPVAHGHDDSGRLLLSQRADKSGMQLVCAADHEVSGSAPAVRAASEPYVATWSAALTAAGPATVDVRVVYLDARRAQPAELVAAAHAELDAYAAAGGVPALLAGQRAYLERFWGSADVVVEGDDAWGSRLTVTDTYDASLFGWQSTSTYALNAEANFVTGGINNFGGYSSQEMDDLWATLSTNTDPEVEKELIIEIESLLNEEGFSIPIFQFPGVVAWRSALEGVSFIPLSPTIFWNYWEWEISAEDSLDVPGAADTEE